MQTSDSVLNSLPYKADFIDSLPAYNTWIGNIERLDLVRDIINSNGYRYQGIAFPGRNLIVTDNYATYGIPPFSQQNGTIPVGRGAVLISIAAYCSNPQGFKFGLFDNTNKQNIIESGIIRADVLGMTTSVDPVSGIPLSGPLFLDTPYVITGDGSIGVTVVNISSGYNIAQVLLNFAVPKTIGTKKAGTKS